MPKRSPDEFAKIAYEAYGERVDWRNYQGLPMPPWDSIGEQIRGAWAAACAAVVDDLLTPPDYPTRAGVAASFSRHTGTDSQRHAEDGGVDVVV